jgi:hypothetical protein
MCVLLCYTCLLYVNGGNEGGKEGGLRSEHETTVCSRREWKRIIQEVFFAPNTRRQFALIKENRRKLDDEVIFIPNTRRQFALIKEIGTGVRSKSSFEEYRRGLEDKLNFAANSRNCSPYQRESKGIR